uniref:Uncharacterized protein n=1 Tax=Arundo donax TaxID=35708 RepID=A0A0A9HQ81_ARUDO
MERKKTEKRCLWHVSDVSFCSFAICFTSCYIHMRCLPAKQQQLLADSLPVYILLVVEIVFNN